MNLIERRNFAVENIPAAISQLGLDGESPFLEAEYRGGQCHVFKLSFKDRQSVAIRVPLYMPDRDQKIRALEQELQTLHILETKSFPWAPRCHGHNLTFDNLVRHPFVVLTWVVGSQLRWDDKFPPQPMRDKVLGQIASIQLSLVECTLEHGVPAVEHFGRVMRNRRKLVREGKVPGLSEKDCIHQQDLLGKMLGEDGLLDTAFAMEHGDIKPDNILVDAECNIKDSVIDWAFAAPVPIARAAGLPRFLWPSSSPDLALSPTVQRDRRVYAASFGSQTSPAAAYMRRWQDGQDVEFRSLYLESLRSKGMHVELAQVGWRLPSQKRVVDEDEELVSNTDSQALEFGERHLRGYIGRCRV